MASYQKIFLAKHVRSKLFERSIANFLLITHLFFILHICCNEHIFLCQGVNVGSSSRLVDRVNSTEIEKHGEQKKLTDHDRRSIINRLQANHNLREIKYVISVNGTPHEICVLFQNSTSTTHQQPIENCRTVSRRSCSQEFVLTNKIRTIHDCEAERLSETCITKTRNQLVQSETVLCQNSGKLVCNGKGDNTNISLEREEICQPNRLAICQKRPKVVTVTETQRLCGKDFQVMNYRTTKMCITHEHETDKTLIGEWKCLDFEHLYQRCLSINVKKQIRSEVTQGGQYSKLECTHKGTL